MELINKRYKVIEKLSSNAVSETYEVIDLLKENRPLSLTIFSAEYSDDSFVRSLIKDFKFYKSIKHRNISELHDFETFEYVDNKPITRVQYLYTFETMNENQKLNYLELTREQSREVLAQICMVLQFLHFRGVIYKYLNLENILIYADSNGEVKVKLRDLVYVNTYKDIINLNNTKTAMFIAPEVLWDNNHVYSSDIYSLGFAVFYIYYRYDITKYSISEVFDPKNDNEVYDLIRRMATSFINDRIDSLDEIVYELSNLLRLNIDMSDIDYYNQIHLNTRLIGRETEINNIYSDIENRLKGSWEKKATLFYGEKGVGKSRLLQEISFRMKYLGDKVIYIDANDNPLDPFSNFRRIIERIIVNYSVNTELIQKYGSEIGKLLPTISEKWNIQIAEILDEEKENLKLSNRIYNFISDYTQYNEIIILIDNIENLSEFEKHVIGYLLRDESEGKLYVVSTSSVEFVETSAFRKWVKTNSLKPTILSKFNYDDANEYIKEILGMNKKPINFTAQIMKELNGNPRLIKNVIQNLFLSEKIYINSQKKWFIKELNNLADIDYNEDIEDSIFDSLGSLKNEEYRLIKLISIFESPVSINVLNKMYSNIDTSITDILENLVEKNLVTERFGDWGYTYSLQSRTVRNNILDSLDEKEKIEYHSQAAELLEEEIKINKNLMSEELIYHLSQSNQIKKAAEFCLFAASQMQDYNIHSQALQYLEKAIDIYKSNDIFDSVPSILLKIGNLLSNIGKYDQSIEKYIEALNIIGNDDKSIISIDVKNKISNIYVIQNKLTQAEEILHQNIITAKELNYIEGEFDSAVELCKMYMIRNNHSELHDIVKVYLSIAESMENEYYIAKLLNELGKYEFLVGNGERALVNFEKSYELFMKLGSNYEAIKPYNNIGVIHYELYGQNSEARKYFQEVIKILDGLNIMDGREVYYQNIGETYLEDDNYLDATYYLNKARSLAEDNSDSNSIFSISLMQCRLYLRIGEYDKAFGLLKKLELEYNLSDNRSAYAKNYYFTHSEYFIKTKNFELAEKWLNDYIQINNSKDMSSQIAVKNYMLAIEYNKKNYLNLSKNIDKDQILEHINSLSNLNNCRFFREALLEIAKGFANSQKFILVQKLLDLDSALREMIDTPVLDSKRLILEGILKDNRIEYFNNLIRTLSGTIIKEDLWFLYKLLGDEYYYKDDYYRSANCYLTALDIIRELTFKLSVEHRESYLIHDESKIELKNKINSLRRKILGKKDIEEKLLFNELEYNSIDSYFEFSIIGDLIKNNKFLNSVYESYEVKYSMRLDNINVLISRFSNEEKYNIYLILLYLVQKTLADRGFVYLLDEFGNVSEVVSTENSLNPPDIMTLIKNTGCDEYGILINSLDDSENKYALSKEQKALICLPIKMTAFKNYEQSRRREDNLEVKEKIVGYLYLESNRIFNYIDDENFDHCKSLTQMLHLMIDNYNLKLISTNDKLTGVYLRKYIEDIFPIELNKARVKGESLSVVMCDIDKFKNINDIYGHRKGDEILSSIGAILKNQLRKTDYIGRYGGEEFIIILPSTDKDVAYDVCEKLRMYIENEKLLGDNKPITMSFGISSYPDHGLSEDELIERADQGLYYSKNNGRNQTTIWNTGIGQDNSRFDKLAGILTGNISNDTRTVQAIINIITVINDNIDKADKLKTVIENILDITDGKFCSIIKMSDNKITEVYTRERGINEWIGEASLNLDLVEMFRNKESGDFFINWNDISEFDSLSNTPNWKSCIVVPLTTNGIVKGQIIITVPIKDKEFDFSSFNFVNSIKGVIGSIL